MKKTILNLSGAQELTRNEQKMIHGGVDGSCMGKSLICYLDIEEESPTQGYYVCEIGGSKNICYCCHLVDPQ